MQFTFQHQAAFGRQWDEIPGDPMALEPMMEFKITDSSTAPLPILQTRNASFGAYFHGFGDQRIRRSFFPMGKLRDYLHQVRPCTLMNEFHYADKFPLEIRADKIAPIKKG